MTKMFVVKRLPQIVCLFFLKKTDFNTILACLRGKVYWWWGPRNFVAEIGEGHKFIDANFFVNLGLPAKKW